MNDQPDLRVVELHTQAMATEIVGSLRRSADSIETETHDHDRTIAGVFVQVTEGRAVHVHAWGKVGNRFEGAGMLQAAIAEVLSA